MRSPHELLHLCQALAPSHWDAGCEALRLTCCSLMCHVSAWQSGLCLQAEAAALRGMTCSNCLQCWHAPFLIQVIYTRGSPSTEGSCTRLRK